MQVSASIAKKNSPRALICAPSENVSMTPMALAAGPEFWCSTPGMFRNHQTVKTDAFAERVAN